MGSGIWSTDVYDAADRYRRASGVSAFVYSDGGARSVHPKLDPRLLGVLAAGLVSHYVPEAWFQRVVSVFTGLPALAQGVVLMLLALSVREMASLEAVPFVYFQF